MNITGAKIGRRIGIYGEGYMGDVEVGEGGVRVYGVDGRGCAWCDIIIYFFERKYVKEGRMERKESGELTDGKTRANKAAFERGLDHAQRNADGKP
jgi:hypothetical protein